MIIPTVIVTIIDKNDRKLDWSIYVSSEELERYVKLGSPFMKSVAEEGVILYDSGIFKKLRESFAGKGRKSLTFS